jgi:hypothetical protein
VSSKNRLELKEIFKAGNIPTGNDFNDFIDSIWNLEDDGEGVPGPTGPTGPSGNKIGYINLEFNHNSVNPSPSTTYYIGDIGQVGTSSGESYRSISLVGGIVNQVYYHSYSNVTGSYEPSGLYLHNITTGISQPITTSATFDSDSFLQIYNIGTPLAVSQGDLIEIIWVTPAWSSPPTGVFAKFEALIEY